MKNIFKKRKSGKIQNPENCSKYKENVAKWKNIWDPEFGRNHNENTRKYFPENVKQLVVLQRETENANWVDSRQTDEQKKR